MAVLCENKVPKAKFTSKFQSRGIFSLLRQLTLCLQSTKCHPALQRLVHPLERPPGNSTGLLKLANAIFKLLLQLPCCYRRLSVDVTIASGRCHQQRHFYPSSDNGNRLMVKLFIAILPTIVVLQPS